MFKIEELSGSLIKSGNFKDAIDPFYAELDEAFIAGCITYNEWLGLSKAFAWILLNPSNYEDVKAVGDKMIALAVRLEKLPAVSTEEFNANVKKSREAK
jgi:hypothetical protein